MGLSIGAARTMGRVLERMLGPALAIAATLLVGCAAMRGASPTSPHAPLPADPNLWRVACDFDNAPFAHLDEVGRPIGRDVEMTELLARRLGWTLEWVQLPFAELLPAVESRRVDAAVATIGITPERADRVRFSRPYFETTIAVVVRRGPGEPRTLADLAHGTVVAGAGTTSERAVLERFGAEVLFSGNKDGQSSAALLLRQLTDAIALDEPNAIALVRQQPQELTLLEQALARERYAIAIPKQDWRRLARIDEELLRLAADGELARLDEAFGLAESVRR